MIVYFFVWCTVRGQKIFTIWKMRYVCHTKKHFVIKFFHKLRYFLSELIYFMPLPQLNVMKLIQTLNYYIRHRSNLGCINLPLELCPFLHLSRGIISVPWTHSPFYFTIKNIMCLQLLAMIMKCMYDL